MEMISRFGLVATLLVAASVSRADDIDARAAQIMWNSWVCSTYAEIKRDTKEQIRLFELGYRSGQQFLDAVEQGTITSAENRNIVPMIVMMLMAGPTSEFVLGRTFEAAARQAYDDVTAEDANGTPLAPADRITDGEIKASIATTKYIQSNCELIR